jgi:hypothetical protein
VTIWLTFLGVVPASRATCAAVLPLALIAASTRCPSVTIARMMTRISSFSWFVEAGINSRQ